MRTYKTMQELAFEAIRGRILGGSLRPGQWVRQDRLAAELGVSRMPVREALRRLADIGLVRLHAHRGTQVIHLDASSVEDLFVTRAALEGTAARLAAGRLGRTDLAALEGLLGQMDRAAARCAFGAYVRLNDRYHQRLNASCGLQTLTATIEAIRSRCALVLRSGLNLPERLAESQKEHHRIYEACHRGDGRAAEKAMREHILRTAKALVARFAKDPGSVESAVLEDLLT